MDEKINTNEERNAVRSQPLTAEKRLITCDEVSWLNDILARYKDAITTPKPDISRQNKSSRLSAILEIMEILQLGFKDRSARHNVLFDFYELYEEKNSEINA